MCIASFYSVKLWSTNVVFSQNNSWWIVHRRTCLFWSFEVWLRIVLSVAWYNSAEVSIQQVINAAQALMINSIITNRPPLTKVFWKYDKHNPLSNALLAFMLQSAVVKLYNKKEIAPPDVLMESIEWVFWSTFLPYIDVHWVDWLILLNFSHGRLWSCIMINLD